MFGKIFLGLKLVKKIKALQDHFICFFKAQCSALLASGIDFVITGFILKCTDFHYVFAVFVGNILGGVVNCLVNYKWVFHTLNTPKCQVALRYLFVWIGSLLFNAWGTFVLTEFWSFLEGICLAEDRGLLYLYPKAIVALLVAFFWNYPMQRKFVFCRS